MRCFSFQASMIMDDAQNGDHAELETRDRLETEIDLLHAMYPGQIFHDGQLRELTYNATPDSGDGDSNERHCALTLRIPASYPSNGLPEVSGAYDHHGKSLTSSFQEMMHNMHLSEGMEALDEIIATFNSLLESQKESDEIALNRQEESKTPKLDPSSADSVFQDPTANTKKTILVWLHHLLNTSKRKQAISPASSKVSGVSKPGYPGVLTFSGPEADVQEHVSGLKALNWQAFQIRLEEDEEWTFGHGAGVKEVGALGELMTDIGEQRKQIVMEAMRMK